MASSMVVRFIDESDFVNKWIGFILRDCSGWELDSTILADLLDDISVFYTYVINDVKTIRA